MDLKVGKEMSAASFLKGFLVNSSFAKPVIKCATPSAVFRAILPSNPSQTITSALSENIWSPYEALIVQA